MMCYYLGLGKKWLIFVSAVWFVSIILLGQAYAITFIVRMHGEGKDILEITRDLGEEPETIFLETSGPWVSAYSKGLTLGKDGNVYFLNGPFNRRLNVIRKGSSQAEIIFEDVFPKSDYNATSLSVGLDKAYILFANGQILGLPMDVNKSSESKVYKNIFDGDVRGEIVLSFDGKYIIACKGTKDVTTSLVSMRESDGVIISKVGDESGAIVCPSYITLISVKDDIFLAVCNDAALKGEKNQGTRRITRIDFNPETGVLSLPSPVNFEGAHAFSLVENSSDNPWAASFDALSWDDIDKKLYFYQRTGHIYGIDGAQIVKGGLTLDDAESLITPSQIVNNIVIIHKK